MVDEIVSGVVSAVAAGFKGVTIYTERVPQGFRTPSFFIEVIGTGESAGLDMYHTLRVPIRVHYFGAGRDLNAMRVEAEEVAGRLYGLLEFITAGRLRRGRRASHGGASAGAQAYASSSGATASV